MITGRSGSIGKVFYIEDDFWPLNTTLYVRNFHGFDPRFVYYLLSGLDLKGYAGGTGVPTLNRNDLHSELVIVPTDINEQQRIVAILDEAFDGIAAAKANAEKNLENARGIFESHLAAVFSARNAGWTDRPLHSLCQRITVGHVGSMANLYKPNGIPFLRSQNIRPFAVSMQNLVFIDDEFHTALVKSSLQAGDVAIVRTGYPGTAAVIPEALGVANCSDLVIVRPGPEVDAHFLAAFFNSAFGKRMVSGKIVGAAQKHFNVGAAKEVVLHLPPLAEQQAIVAAADELRGETGRLEMLYASKLALLEELKKSLLHQAFSGRLSSFERRTSTLQETPQTTTPEFAANVISFAYARHERQKREKTFGHVKEQKLLHLVESIAGIDLGRQPMRDAAGPNDFQHMLRAENWAKVNGFFDVVKRGEGYEFSKLSSFDEYTSRARRALAPYLSQLEPVIDLLIPMDTEEAEVFATVHAAWNNLLIDGVQATDDGIVSAAREGWHPDKLKIPEHKFRSAIEKIRQKKLVPDGSAKYVGGQKALFDEPVRPTRQL